MPRSSLRAFSLFHGRLEPETCAANLGDDQILLTYRPDVDRQLVQLSEQGVLAVLKAAGLVDHTTLDTRHKLVKSGGMLIAQDPGRHQWRDGASQKVLGFRVETHQQIGLLQLVNRAQLALHRDAILRQIVDIRTQQCDSRIEGSSMILFSAGQLQTCLEGGLE